MTGVKPRVVNALSLLTHKVAGDVYDLSCGLQNVSIRDQIARGSLVARDLVASGEPIANVLVVGAGFSGTTAALQLASSPSVQRVVLADREADSFSAQMNSRLRYVGAYMYEWPSHFYEDQSFPSPDLSGGSRSISPLKWTSSEPLPANQLVEMLAPLVSYGSGTASPDLNKIQRQQVTARSELKAYLRKYARSQRGSRPVLLADSFKLNSLDSESFNKQMFVPDIVILAAGMGKENSPNWRHAPRTPPFWEDDDLLSSTQGQRIAVIGGGDGALQDTLRTLTKRHHPLEILRFLRSKESVYRAISGIEQRLFSSERQARLHNAWSAAKPSYDVVDQLCARVAEDLSQGSDVSTAVEALISPESGVVHLIVKDAHFSRSYLLNRFLVHLIAAVESKRAPSKRRLFVHFSTPVTNVTKMKNRYYLQVGPGGGVNQVPKLGFHRVVQRLGVKPDPLLMPQIGLSDGTELPRTTLSAVELPFVIWD